MSIDAFFLQPKQAHTHKYITSVLHTAKQDHVAVSWCSIIAATHRNTNFIFITEHSVAVCHVQSSMFNLDTNVNISIEEIVMGLVSTIIELTAFSTGSSRDFRDETLRVAWTTNREEKASYMNDLRTIIILTKSWTNKFAYASDEVYPTICYKLTSFKSLCTTCFNNQQLFILYFWLSYYSLEPRWSSG